MARAEGEALGPGGAMATRSPTGWAAAHAVTALALGQQLLTLTGQLLVARRYGAGPAVDAWVAAQAIPALLASVLAALAGQLALPALHRARERGGEPALRATARALLSALLVAGLLLAAPLTLAAEGVLALTGPGLGEAATEPASRFLRLLALGLLPAGANALLAQAAHLRGRFAAVAALAPLVAAGQLLAFLAAPPGEALSWMIAAQAAASLLLLPVSAGLAGGLRPGALAPGAAALREIAGRSLPVLAIVASTRVHQAVDAFFASGLPPGELASLGYASRGVWILQAVLAAPVASVVFTRLTLHAGDTRALGRTALRACESGLFLSVGASLVLVGLAPRAAALLFGAAPGAEPALGVARCLALLGGVVAAGVWGSVLLRLCLAARLERFAAGWLGAVPMAVNVALDAAVVGPFGVAGLAAATSLNALLGLPPVHALLRRRGVMAPGLGRALARFVLAAVPAGVLLARLPAAGAQEPLVECLALALHAALALALYAAVVQALGGRVTRLLKGL